MVARLVKTEVSLALAGVVVALAVGAGLTLGTSPVEALTDSDTHAIAGNGVGWTVAEVHAAPNETFRGAGYVEVQFPPEPIRIAFMAFDETWNQVGGMTTIWTGYAADSSEVRVRGPDDGERHLEGPDGLESAQAEGTSPYNASTGYEFEGDSDGTLVGYIALMTNDPGANMTVERTSSGGWLGNATMGSNGSQLVEESDFDSVGFHGHVNELGPSVTLDATEQRSVNDSLLGAMSLTPGSGKAGYDGPGNEGYHCDQRFAEDCRHRHALAGPDGSYTFQIDRHTMLANRHEAWLMTADIDRP